MYRGAETITRTIGTLRRRTGYKYARVPLEDVPIAPLSPERFREILGDRFAELEENIAATRELLWGRVVWHVNSTATGGGVAELLHSLLAYTRGAGVDTRWKVIEGGPEFFRITKRLHNNLHGSPGDGGDLGPTERGIYERELRSDALELSELVRAGDVVYLHDPQTAGMTASLAGRGVKVVWRCHVGLDTPNDCARQAWDFLRPYVEAADVYVFSREAFAWEGLDRDRIVVVPPSIDAFSPKNQEMAPEVVAAILKRIGLARDAGTAPTFHRQDGTPGRVDREAEVVQDAPLGDEPLITQVSRWDRLKDPTGVLRGFVEHCRAEAAHLLLAGPAVEGVSDDPEGAEVLREVKALRGALPVASRARVHLASLPMEDSEENAAMVNAIQRGSTVVVQKSLAEGFGLTVAEAMWKERPVVGSRVGGIQEQIVDGESGILLDDPTDLAAFGRVLEELIAEPARAERIGLAAAERVRDRFLGTRHLIQYARVIAALLD